MDAISPSTSSSASSCSSSSISPSTPPPDIPSLKETLTSTPTYSAHAALISALRQTADLPSLRQARSEFAAQFPLSPSLWQEWLQDELRIASPSQHVDLLNNLFATAVRDFLHPNLHLMRLEFAIQLCDAGTIPTSHVHKIVEDSWWLGCFHAGPQAQPVWNLFTKFLHSTGESAEPHAWMSAGTLLDTAPTHPDVYAACTVFEEKLKASRGASESGYVDEHRGMLFRSYAAYARSVDEGLVIGVYERFVGEAFADGKVWGEYCLYCAGIKRKGFARYVAGRACRNAPWDMWVWRWRVMTVSSGDELRDVVDKVKRHVMTSENYAGAEWLVKAIWGMYAKFEGAEEEEWSRVMGSLSFNVEGSVNWARGCAFAADMLVGMGKMEEGIEVMDKVVEARGGEDWVWIEYGSLMERGGKVEKGREAFARGLGRVQRKWEVDKVGDAWLRFECRCQDKHDMRERMAKVNVAVAERLENMGAVKEFGEGNEMQRGQEIRGKDARTNRNLPKRKRPRRTEAKEEDDTKENKQEKEAAGDQMDTSEREDMAAMADKIKEDAMDHGDNDDKTNQEGAARGSKDRVGSVGGGEEPRTVFVNNLPYNASEETLRAEFSFAGEIISVRIPRRNDGASKGIAYIEFRDEGMVERSLEKHRQVIMGRTVWVRRSKPPGKKGRRGRGGAARGRGGRGGRRGRIIGRRSRIDVGGASEAGGADEMEAEKMDDEVVEPKTQAELRAMFVGK